MSNSLWPHGLQHTRLPCPSLFPRVSSNSCVSIKSVMPSNLLILSNPLLFLPSIFPSISVISSESALPIRWPKYWSYSFSISLSNEYSGLISLKIDWFDLLAVQGTRKSLLQYLSLKASALQCSAFFMVQLSHLYMTTGKTIALTWRIFVCKVMSLLFNTLFRFAISFLPRSKHLWKKDLAAVTVCSDFRAQKYKELYLETEVTNCSKLKSPQMNETVARRKGSKCSDPLNGGSSWKGAPETKMNYMEPLK